MSQKHPDFSILAARIAVSNLHKNTSDSFFETCQILHDYVDQQGRPAALLAEDMWQFVQANAQELDDAIDYKRDFGPALRSDPYWCYKAVMTRKTMNNYSSSCNRGKSMKKLEIMWFASSMQSRCVRLGVGLSLNFCCSQTFFPVFLPSSVAVCTFVSLFVSPSFGSVLLSPASSFVGWGGTHLPLWFCIFFNVCLPACRGLMSILSYHLSSIRPYLSTTGPLLALACLLRAVLMSFSPRLFHCLSLRCCLASWGFTSTCLLIVTYLFVYLNLIHLIIIFHVCTRSVWGSRLWLLWFQDLGEVVSSTCARQNRGTATAPFDARGLWYPLWGCESRPGNLWLDVQVATSKVNWGMAWCWM